MSGTFLLHYAIWKYECSKRPIFTCSDGRASTWSALGSSDASEVYPEKQPIRREGIRDIFKAVFSM
jgi:hypothetical protein